MRRAFLVAAALGAVCSSTSVLATKQIKSKLPVKIDDKLGYVVARIASGDPKGSADRVLLYRIDPQTSRLRTAFKKTANPVAKGEDSFAFVGGSKSFSFGVVDIDGGQAGVFLTSLTPGEWVIVGTDSTCACMGSYRFTVMPGHVTDLGTVIAGITDLSSPFIEFRAPPPSADLLEKAYTVPEAIAARPAVAEQALPGLLSRLPVTAATLIETRFDNVGGWMINRMRGLAPLGHETSDAAAAVTDPRFPLGTSMNRWPDVKEEMPQPPAN